MTNQQRERIKELARQASEAAAHLHGLGYRNVATDPVERLRQDEAYALAQSEAAVTQARLQAAISYVAREAGEAEAAIIAGLRQTGP